MSKFSNKLSSMFGFKTSSLKEASEHLTQDSLKSFAAKNNLHIQRTEKGDFVSVPVDSLDNTYMSFYENWTSTYCNTGSFTGTNRTNVYAMYDVMDENMTEASMMLDTYAEEAISFGLIDDPIKIHVSDPEAEKVLFEVLERNKILRRAKADIRTMCKYGDAGYALEFPKSLYEAYDKLTQEEKERTDPLEFFNVHDLDIYPINPRNFIINSDEHGNVITYSSDNGLQTNNSRVVSSKSTLTRFWQPWQFARFSLEDDNLKPYGRSILYGLRTLFDQLSTLEALLAMSRASKVQRLVIKIPVTSRNAVEAFNQISRTKAQFKSTIFSDAAGTKSGRKVAGLTETFFLPSGPEYSIDSIKNDIDIASTEDVDHFLEKALRATKLPKGFFSGEETGDDSGAALAERDQKFSKALLNVQNSYANGLVDLSLCILAHAGFLVNELEVTVEIERPSRISKSTIDEYKTLIDFATSLRETLQSDNPEIQYPITNFAQFLILLGIPMDYVKLLIARNPIQILEDADLYHLMSGLEVKLYNYDKSNRKKADDIAGERNEKGELVYPEKADNEVNEEPEENDDGKETFEVSPYEIEGDDGKGHQFSLVPDRRKVSSVSNAKDLKLYESGMRKVITRCSSISRLNGEPRLKQDLKEVAMDLSRKKQLNECKTN